MKLSEEVTEADMDCAPNVNIFRELQAIHDTGYFSGHVSPEDDWQQVCEVLILDYRMFFINPCFLDNNCLDLIVR